MNDKIKLIGIAVLVCVVVVIAIGLEKMDSKGKETDTTTVASSAAVTTEVTTGSEVESTETLTVEITSETETTTMEVTTETPSTEAKTSEVTTNAVQDEQTTTQEATSNDASGHIDENMEEIIALIDKDVYNFDSEKTSPITNYTSIYVLVNKKNDLPSDYVPAGLVVPDITFSFTGNNPKKQLRPEAAEAIEGLFKDSKTAGLNIYALSGYRSYDKQSTIYQGNVSSMGEAAANKVSAKPGQSEHQTGLAMDVTSESAGYDLVESFGNTEEGIWLAAHAHQYGFIIRYQKDKTDVTGYSYEPWHIRYVGVTLAAYLYDNDLTLDQFYEQLSND